MVPPRAAILSHVADAPEPLLRSLRRAAAALGAGMLIGSSAGPRVARRLPSRLLRGIVVTLGLALAVQLAIDPHL